MILRQDLRQQAAVIFDFDGTVALGHGPVRAYADAIPAERLANSAAFAEQVEVALAELDDLTSDYRDGYHAVAELATAQGVSPEALSQAYIASRRLLGTDKAPVHMPRKLPELLHAISEHAWVVLATNAPDDGIEALLSTWNIRQYFDQLSFNSRKPAGMTQVIEGLGARRILAIGDIAENDLDPAAELGAQTLLVTPHHTLDDAAADIIAWAHQGK